MAHKYPDTRLKRKTTLEQAQFVMLKILKSFDKICEKYSLCYWLDAGTLLGAVRHGGFIPWDDDLDLVMPHEDYVKFCSIAEKELPEDMFFQSPETDPGFVCPWVKIRDRYSHIDEAGGPYPYSQAIFIDIFPASYVTQRHARWRIFYILLEPYLKKTEKIDFSLKPLSIIKNLCIKSLQVIFLAFMKIKPLQKAFLSYLEKGEKTWQYDPPIRWKNAWPQDMIFPLQKIKFENSKFWAPHNTHEYLKDYYGNYMELPPENERSGGHAVTAIYPTGPNPHFSALEWNKK